MLLGLVWTMAANAFGLLAAHALLDRFRTGRGDLDAVGFLVLHAGLLSALVFGAGLVGLLRALPLGAACTFGLIALIAAGRHRRFFEDARAVLRFFRPAPGIGFDARATRLLGAALASALLAALLFHAWIFPPYWLDLTSYQLPHVAEWVRDGRLHFEGGFDPRAPFPAGFQLILAWWTVFLHHDVLIELGGIQMYALAAAATFALARGLGLPKSGAAWASILLMSVPAWVSISATGSNDSAAAAIVLACFALTWPGADRGRASRSALALSAFLIGVGMKPTVGWVGPAFVALWWWGRKSSGPSVDTGRLCRVIVVSVALSLGAFWYVKNAVVFGNPIYPSKALDASGLTRGTSEQGIASLGRVRKNLRDLADSRVYDRSPINPSLKHVSGWGWFVLACGFPAVLLAVLRSRDFRIMSLAFLSGIVVVMAFSKDDAFNSRFILWAPALACIAIPMALAEPWPKAARIAFGLIVAFGGVLNLVCTIVPCGLNPRDVGDVIRRPWHERSELTMRGHPPLLMADDQPLAVLSPLFSNYYALYGPRYGRRLVRLEVETFGALSAGMKGAGLRYVYVTEGGQNYESMLLEAARSGLVKPLLGRLYVLP